MERRIRRTYEERLRVPIEGNPRIVLRSCSGVRIATGYTRIVIGERGPYVELGFDNLNCAVLREVDERHHYYVELRTIPDNVKVYAQVHRVDYADYVPGMCYVSPFDLVTVDGAALIERS